MLIRVWNKWNISVKKPWAPILLPLDTVSVTISRKWEKVYVGVGSNMGDKQAYLQAAFEGIEKDETAAICREHRCMRRSHMDIWIKTNF